MILKKFFLLGVALMFVSLASCGGGGSGASFTVGGVIVGLGDGESVVLQNNLRDNLTVSNNSEFTFATPLADGSFYDVTVLTKPSGKTCSVAHNEGSIDGANVTNVSVVCSEFAYTVGGTVAGLGSGESVVIQLNLDDDLTVSADGAFTFPTALADGIFYDVTVLTKPSGKTCSVAHNEGSIDGANVTDVSVVCSVNAYTVGGTVAGLESSKSLVIQVNLDDDLTITANEAFTFPTALADGLYYDVTVSTNPDTMICVPTNNTGTISGANVTDVLITCSSVAKKILSFEIDDRVGEITESAITVIMPTGTDVTNLSPTIIISEKASVSPASGIAQDFTDPVLYTVTAEDGTTKPYTVTVTVAGPAAKDITYFKFEFSKIVENTEITDNAVNVGIPRPSFPLTNLTPIIQISGKSISPASGVAQDFTNPVEYTVTANDDTTKVYTVTATDVDYALRDIGPSGGYILYVDASCNDDSCYRYYEASHENYEARKQWSDPDGITGAVGTIIGTGATNTSIIFDWLASVGQSDMAAQYCNELELTYGGTEYFDWFLPSRGEQWPMYVNLYKDGVGGFSKDWYWSSSEYEYGGRTAWILDFSSITGVQYNDGKVYYRLVRCARSF